MKKIKKVLLATLAVALVLCVGCGKTAKEELTMGEFKDNHFTNEYFGVSLDTPESWIALSEDEINKLTDMGADAIYEGDEKKKEAAKKISDRTSVVFFMHKMKETTSPEEDMLTPKLSMVAEKIFPAQKIETSEDYLQSVMDQIKAVDQGLYTYTDIESTDINGETWSHYTSSIKLTEDITLYSENYAIKKKGYVLYVPFSYYDGMGDEDTKNFINSIKFEK